MLNFKDLEVQGNQKGVAGKITPASPEPGNKIPLYNYKQIGQFCEFCYDTTAHVYSSEKKKIRCLKCRTTTIIN